jgi:hypothetical protein
MTDVSASPSANTLLASTAPTARASRARRMAAAGWWEGRGLVGNGLARRGVWTAAARARRPHAQGTARAAREFHGCCRRRPVRQRIASALASRVAPPVRARPRSATRSGAPVRAAGRPVRPQLTHRCQPCAVYRGRAPASKKARRLPGRQRERWCTRARRWRRGGGRAPRCASKMGVWGRHRGRPRPPWEGPCARGARAAGGGRPGVDRGPRWGGAAGARLKWRRAARAAAPGGAKGQEGQAQGGRAAAGGATAR